MAKPNSYTGSYHNTNSKLCKRVEATGKQTWAQNFKIKLKPTKLQNINQLVQLKKKKKNPILIPSGPSHLCGCKGSTASLWGLAVSGYRCLLRGPEHKDSKDLDKILTEQETRMLSLYIVPMISLALASIYHTVTHHLASSK